MRDSESPTVFTMVASRFVFASVLVLTMGVLLAGTATAQAPVAPVVHTRIEWTSLHGNSREMTLPPDLRADMTFYVHLSISGDYACPNTAIVAHVEVISGFPQWAGASLEPNDKRNLVFTIPQGLRSAENEIKLDGPTFNLAWQEDAPENASWQYEIAINNVEYGGQSPACVPDPMSQDADHMSETMTVRKPYIAPDEVEEVPCIDDPSQARCAMELQEQGDSGGIPGFDAVFLIAALGLLTMVLRRRKA